MRATPALLIFAVVLVAFTACAPPASTGGFDSDNPASKLYAIRRAGEERDRSAIPQLVEQLDNDDPAVRLLTINALERITGTRLGYNPYDAPLNREEAVNRWVSAVQSGQFEKE